jgi:hypothetical protein
MNTQNVLKGTNSKILLIGKIKGLAGEVKHTRKLLLKAKTEKRVWQCAHTKRIIGLDIRHHLLAYAFMRGEAYHNLEKKCRPEHQPNAESILQIVHAHLPWFQSKTKWTVERVQDWLKGEVS